MFKTDKTNINYLLAYCHFAGASYLSRNLPLDPFYVSLQFSGRKGKSDDKINPHKTLSPPPHIIFLQRPKHVLMNLSWVLNSFYYRLMKTIFQIWICNLCFKKNDFEKMVLINFLNAKPKIILVRVFRVWVYWIIPLKVKIENYKLSNYNSNMPKLIN